MVKHKYSKRKPRLPGSTGWSTQTRSTCGKWGRVNTVMLRFQDGICSQGSSTQVPNWPHVGRKWPRGSCH